MQVDQIQELENDSDYEDLEDDEIDEATILTSMLDRDLLKVTIIFSRFFAFIFHHRRRLMTINLIVISNLD